MMHHQGFEETIEKLVQRDGRYQPEAYAFLRDSLEATLKRRKKRKKETGPHVGAAELLDGFRLHALGEFGPMALTVLDYWGVGDCEDVGNMVFNLVEAGVFGKTEDDTIESFRGVFDFEEVFSEPFRPSGNPVNGSRSGGVRSFV